MKGRVPEEDKGHPPRASPGSHHLPWDTFSIPTKELRLPEGGAPDGEFVSAKTAGGDFRLDLTTNVTAKSRIV
jgi:hypothetical protein